MRKIAVVDLKGGLGNQIFQLAFALNLRSSKMLTYIDTHFYDLNQKFPRDLEVHPGDFGFKSIKVKNNKIFKFLGTFFEERETFTNEDFKIINRFVGYYQDFKYLDNYKSDIKNKLDLNSQTLINNRVAIHVRKTDYATINQELPDSYYMQALESLSKISKNLELDIYTDSSEIKLDSSIFKNVNRVIYPKLREKPIDVLRSLLNYKYYIIANSSFSALAAYFSDHSNKVVYYPDPWFNSSEFNIKNIPSDWTSVEQ